MSRYVPTADFKCDECGYKWEAHQSYAATRETPAEYEPSDCPACDTDKKLPTECEECGSVHDWRKLVHFDEKGCEPICLRCFFDDFAENYPDHPAHQRRNELETN